MKHGRRLLIDIDYANFANKRNRVSLLLWAIDPNEFISVLAPIGLFPKRGLTHVKLKRR